MLTEVGPKTAARVEVFPIRNLQIITSPGVGGRELVPPALARRLLDQGHPTWLMCRPGTLVERLGRAEKIPVVGTDLRGYFHPRAILALARFLRRERIQVVQAHWSRDLANVIFASTLAGGVPVVLTKHVYATQSKRDLFHDWLYRHTDAVIAVSRLVAENVAQTTATPQVRIVTIYNGIDLEDTWNPARVSGTNLRPEFGVPDGAPVLGYAGRLNRGKGPHLIVEAFRLLAERFPDWHLVLVGRAVGPQEEAYAAELKHRVVNGGLGARVHFAGFRGDMPAVMHTFDLLVCPSAFESLGMVVVEAMALERPVLGADAGGIPEIIQPGENGELFRGGDVRDLADKLSLLLADPGRRRTQGRAGRRIARERFDLDRSATQVAAVLRRVIAARKRSPAKLTPA